MWGWISYDPELDLIYHGTGNPGPWNSEQRPGDNRWATSVLARGPRGRELRWAFQSTPADIWDYDSTQENILADLTDEGAARGRRWSTSTRMASSTRIDRATGELLSRSRTCR